jgi:hypothetical protein
MFLHVYMLPKKVRVLTWYLCRLNYNGLLKKFGFTLICRYLIVFTFGSYRIDLFCMMAC